MDVPVVAIVCLGMVGQRGGAGFTTGISQYGALVLPETTHPFRLNICETGKLAHFLELYLGEYDTFETFKCKV